MTQTKTPKSKRDGRKRLRTLFAAATLASAPVATTDIINADLFAGGGGASLGIELALGESPHIAINHDRAAIEMHAKNHPDTLHYTEDVWRVNPKYACRGLPVGMLWASPDCKHFSKAKGGKPVNKRIRSLAWIVVKWAKLPKWQRPRVIFVENVEEFRDWGPLMRDPRYPGEDKWIPNPKRKGEIFRRWCNALQKLGFKVEFKILNAADYGVPTIRKRLFIVARCDGEPITWPEPSHAKVMKDGTHKEGMLPWVPVSECIDWNRPCPSIFDKAERKRLGLKPELAERTMQRIAKGILRYVIQNNKPFLIRIGHWSNKTDEGRGFRGQGLDQPVGTITAQGNDKAIVSPVLTKVNNTGCKNDGDRSMSVTQPLHTITGKHGTGLSAAVLARVGNTGGNGSYVNSVDEPLRTIVSKNQDQLIETFLERYAGEKLQAPALMKFRGNSIGTSVTDPCPTITSGAGSERPAGAAHALGVMQATIAPIITKHYGNGVLGHGVDRPLGTVTAVDHHSLTEATLAPLITSHYGESVGRDVEQPLATMTAANHHSLTTATLKPADDTVAAVNLVHFNHGEKQWSAVDEPARTITAGGNHAALVQALLIKYYGTNQTGQPVDRPLDTITAKARFGLVTVVNQQGENELWQIVDIGMRMLEPEELLNAQFHPDVAKNYKLTGSKSSKVARIGNSVPPLVVRALVKANYRPIKKKVLAA